MTNAELIQTINVIRDNDKAEKIKRGERKPTNQKLVITIAVIVTLIILIAPAVIFAICFPDANTVAMNLFIYGLVALIFGSLLFWRRCRILRFLSVKDAHALVDKVDVHSGELMQTILAKDALVFAGELDDKSYNLIYNWLKHRQMLRGERLNVYRFAGDQLRHAVNRKMEILDYAQFYAIRLDELDIDSPQKDLFAREHFFIANGRWLSDLLSA